MSLEAIENITQTETAARERKLAAEAQAKQIIADARQDGQALIQRVQEEAAQQGRELLRAAEAKASADEYAKALGTQDNVRLLQKGIRAGQLSMVEYFVNLATFYDSMENLLQLRNEEQKALAELYKYRL